MIERFNIIYEIPVLASEVSMEFVPPKLDSTKVFNDVRVIDYLK